MGALEKLESYPFGRVFRIRHHQVKGERVDADDKIPALAVGKFKTVLCRDGFHYFASPLSILYCRFWRTIRQAKPIPALAFQNRPLYPHQTKELLHKRTRHAGTLAIQSVQRRRCFQRKYETVAPRLR